MANIEAANGQIVTDQMITDWESALECDEWPQGWENHSEIIYGRPPLNAGASVTLSIKVPAALKQAITQEAKKRGTTTSNYARALLAAGMLAS